MRCKFRTQASKATQSQASCLSSTLTKSRQWFAKKTRTVTLLVLLGLGGGIWVTTEAITPHIVQAQIARLEYSLVRQPEETYEDLLRRAEAAANAEAQANFDQGDGATNVAITILAQNQGEIAPILSLQVSREQWLSQPDAQRWATYFTNAKVLLGFEDVAATSPDQPYTNTVEATPEQPQTDTSVNTGTEVTNTSGDTGGSQDFDGAASQPGATFSTPTSNPVPSDDSTTPSSNTTSSDENTTPSSDTNSSGGSVLTPQAPVIPGTQETPANELEAYPDQQSTSGTTSDGIDD